jgi:hypothetical protein
MAAWGPGIFSDDVACDVRDAFREFIGAGDSPEDATAKTLEFRAETFADIDDGKVAWLALALTQWRCGRLVTSVRDKALQIIAEGGDSQRWENAADRRERIQVLQKAKRDLLSPQRPPVAIKTTHLSVTPYTEGDVLAYRHPSGYELACRVFENFVAHHATGDAIYSWFQVIAVGSPDIPQLRKLSVARPPLFAPEGGLAESIQFALLDAELAEQEGWRLLGKLAMPGQIQVSRKLSGLARVKRSKRMGRFEYIDDLISLWLSWMI